jgi:TRAP-type mannitol/chloroaromatic compound transport system substrate-binding protein
VQSGAYPIGHTASYYYTGLGEWTAFGTGLPFGLTSRQQNAWLYDGGGLTMLQGLYDRHFGVIQFPAGNTGGQMGGWFRNEITSVDDLDGLRMRIPGPGGRVMARLGVSVQQLPGGELYQALESGAIDAVEWAGPHDDLNLGFAEIAHNYYYPGWWDVGPTAEVQVNKAAWEALPDHYRLAIEAAAYKANLVMTARYDARNAAALANLEEAGVRVLPFPGDVIDAAREASFAIYDELAAADEDFAAVYEPWNAFRQRLSRWFAISEASMLAITAPTGACTWPST